MKQQLLITSDGSHTIFVPDLNEHYHSVNGAVQESLHVFINAGFNHIQADEIRILEIGFGTGLNALLTLNEAKLQNKKVYYESIEAYPINADIWSKLNYKSFLLDNECDYFELLHSATWGNEVEICPQFNLTKIHAFLNEYTSNNTFDLIYFDAFAPDIQPELWTLEVFEKMAHALHPNGVLVTYSSKGIVKQNLRQAGFTVTRLQGAGGKRHMLRAIR